MAISASQVSELRRMTDCGMMDCKKALEETAGDLSLAVEMLRKKGIAKAAKKADRVASEGVIKVNVSSDRKRAVMLEVNCETDFVARDDHFQQFTQAVADLALIHAVKEVDELAATKMDGEKTVEEVRQELIAKVGENICIRRIAALSTTGTIDSYTHGHKIGVLLSLIGDAPGLGKDLAMHIAASKPVVVSPEQIDPAIIEQEKIIYKAQALESGKPENIVDKMVEGRVKKFVNEVSLVGQPFVKDTDMTVGELLKQKHATVELFIRFELGEGIQKSQA